VTEGTALSNLILVGGVVLLLWIVRTDIASLKITNRSILILAVIYVAWAAATGFTSIWGDLAAGTILFALALVLWLLRMMGAGDVKLYAVIGCLVGIDLLFVYTLLLLAVSVILVIAIQTLGRSPRATRLREMKTSGKVPYSVPICAAAIPAVLLRAFG
jgi:prepilin peptidase CpaA